MTSKVTLTKLNIVNRIAISILETTVGVEKFIEILTGDPTSVFGKSCPFPVVTNRQGLLDNSYTWAHNVRLYIHIYIIYTYIYILLYI